jgi:hypothetical protein
MIITPLFTGLFTMHHEDPQTIYDEWTAVSDTYNIMLASLGTTPLEIIYAGRLEYACVHVCVCVFASSAG